jgi:hypothetical protein
LAEVVVGAGSGCVGVAGDRGRAGGDGVAEAAKRSRRRQGSRITVRTQILETYYLQEQQVWRLITHSNTMSGDILHTRTRCLKTTANTPSLEKYVLYFTTHSTAESGDLPHTEIQNSGNSRHTGTPSLEITTNRNTESRDLMHIGTQILGLTTYGNTESAHLPHRREQNLVTEMRNLLASRKKIII